jgi:uncharacterized membrane-anchored protein YitT (DUF2179 family)
MNNLLEKKDKKFENESLNESFNNKNDFNSQFNLTKIFNWGWFKFSKCILGIFIFSLAINLFIVPNNLYTGGILGLAQLIRNLINSVFNIKVKIDISSIIYYLINIPLFLMAYKRISKTCK